MSKPTAASCPERVANRIQAVQLWKYLLMRGISFHWEDDAREWVDARGTRMLEVREATHVMRLFEQVEALEEPGCYDDAISLLKLASLTEPSFVARVPAHHASAFETCSTPVEAVWVLEQVA